MLDTGKYQFDEDAALLRSQARRLLAERLSSDTLHRLVAADHQSQHSSTGAWDTDLWQQIKELGWHTLAVPASLGGAELSHMAIAGLMEEFGRAAVPGPLAATLYATLVLRHCAGGQGALEEIAQGRSASIAVANRQGVSTVGASDVQYRDKVLNGSAFFVQDGLKSERFLVVATGAEGSALFWVSSEAEGLDIEADDIVDLTRDQASLRFTNVIAERVDTDAAATFAHALPAIWTMLAADIAGAAEWQLQTTVDYVSTRKQFERPLGFFQAVKHPLVNVMIQVDETRSLLYHAATMLDARADNAALAAHMAKASANETAGFASSRSVQYHGGIGFTWECHVQLYFKRQMHSRMLWGDANWHRARLAEILMGPVRA